MTRPKSPRLLYTKSCLNCNREFSYISYAKLEIHQPKTTCSKECQYAIIAVGVAATRQDLVHRECKYCGNAYVAEFYRHKTFCSNSCRLLYLASLTGEKNPAWLSLETKKMKQNIRSKLRKIIISDVTVCGDCGVNGMALEVHHIDKNRNNNILENLIPLCLECHALRHIGERAENLIRSKRNSPTPKKLPIVCKQCNSEFLPTNDKSTFCSRHCAKIYYWNNPHPSTYNKRK